MVMTYTISVNGKAYDVSVEKRNGATAVQTIARADVAPSVSPSIKVMPSTPRTGGNGMRVSAPMPGKVIAIKVNVGDRVRKDQEVAVVEAMKMHNPILVPSDGLVTEIYVKAGDSIQTGQPLVAVG